MGDIPPMAFDTSQLLSREHVKDGPIVVYWNQDREEIARETPPDVKDRPLRWRRLVGLRRWKFVIRLAPPPDETLREWGAVVARRLGMTWRDPLDTDRAIWVYGGVFSRNAAAALGSTRKVFEKLRGVDVGAVQIRVEHWA